VFAYQTKQQAGFFLKDLVPLPAIGRAYVWRDGPGVELRSCALTSGRIQGACQSACMHSRVELIQQ